MSQVGPTAAMRRSGVVSTRRKLGISRASFTGAVLAVVMSLIAAIFSANPGLVIGCGVLLAIILLALWQENEPPLLMIPAAYQWLAVSTKPLVSTFTHVPVNALAEYPIDLTPGIVLALFAVGALSLGMRIGLGRPTYDWNARLRNEAIILKPGSLLTVAISAILLGHLLLLLPRFAPVLTQPLIAVANIRFLGLFALAYWCFVNRRGYSYLLLVSLLEILIGITGFFSEFRTPIFVIGFAALAAGHRPKARDLAWASCLIAVLVLLGSFWSAIKLDYRLFMSGGTMEQVVTVPLSDRIDYLQNQVETFDQSRLAEGFNLLLKRQSYVDFLSATMGYVPQSLPHEHGARLGKAVLNIITPRVLFPDKPATDFDTDVTARYTGLPLQVTSHTSISIGYVGELYIDFGRTGAVIACFFLGCTFGYAYRLLRKERNASALLSYGARSTLLVVMMSFETALIKYVGAVGLTFLAAFVLQRYLVPLLTRQLRLRRHFERQNAAFGGAV